MGDRSMHGGCKEKPQQQRYREPSVTHRIIFQKGLPSRVAGTSRALSLLYHFWQNRVKTRVVPLSGGSGQRVAAPIEFLAQRTIITLPRDREHAKRGRRPPDLQAISGLQTAHHSAVDNDAGRFIGVGNGQFKRSIGGIHHGSIGERMGADGRQHKGLHVFP